MKVYVAGHRGLVGSASVRALRASGHEVWIPERRYDLRQSTLAFQCLTDAVRDGVSAVVLAAARVGGIGANVAEPADFLFDNLRISINVVSCAHELGISRLVNLGSSCIYPRTARQPIRETALLSGPLEPTNESYAVAKIAALKIVQAFRRQHGARYVSLMPCNLYGPGDRYDLQRSHVIPTLIMKYEHARCRGGPVVLWGDGSPLREFLHVDDLARAIVWALEQYDDDLWLNVGSHDEVSIRELASLVAELVGYTGETSWDETKPNGVWRKKLDWSRIAEKGWRPSIPLRQGVQSAIDDYRARNIAL